jgi:hypothetical protein
VAVRAKLPVQQVLVGEVVREPVLLPRRKVRFVGTTPSHRSRSSLWTRADLEIRPDSSVLGSADAKAIGAHRTGPSGRLLRTHDDCGRCPCLVSRLG